MYKCLVIVLFLITNVLLFSKEMAVLPFEGKDLTEEAGKAIADGFINELGALGYSLISGSPSELKAYYKQLGDKQKNPMLSKEEAGKVGKQLGADWVLIGEFRKFNETITISAKIIDVETSQIIASSSGKLIKTDYDILIENMVSELHGKLDAREKGIKYVSAEDRKRMAAAEAAEEARRYRSQAQSQQSYTLSRNMQKYETAKTVKWVGRGLWIGGLALAVGAVGADIALNYNHQIFGFMTSPSRSQVLEVYSSENEYFNNHPDSMIYQDADKNTLMAFFWGGLAIAAVGATLDIAFSIQEKNLGRAIQYSFMPYVLPDINGNVNMGGTFYFSYKF